MLKIIRNFFLFVFMISQISGMAQSKSSYSLAVLQYRGGGDWYSNPTSVPNLAQFCRQQLGLRLGETQYVDVSSAEIFDYPFIHMTGHGNVVFNSSDILNLQAYLISGGFLHIDDNYGMDPFVRAQLKKVFPEKELVEVPFDHPIYHQKFDFDSGLPKVHEHDDLPPRGYGLFHEGRMIVFYSYESDLGDGWEDEAVHGDPEETRIAAMRMGANLVQYALTGEADPKP